ncbi:hypothetical protein [Pseudoalteromonas phage PH357]|nr:hypothetical protein [Pseudoalteromonas phage PH357]
MSNITKQEAIEQLCELCSTVGAISFRHKMPHDCFCGENKDNFRDSFQFDQSIIDYIKEAVDEKLYNDEKDL